MTDASYLRLCGSAISVLDFRGTNDCVRFAVLPICASVRCLGETGLDLIVDGTVEISSAHIGIEHGLVLREFFCAGRVLRQARPCRPGRSPGNRNRDGSGGPGMIAAAKSN